MGTRQRRNAEIGRSSSGVGSVEGGLVLARKSDNYIFRQRLGPKFVHDKWTGSWGGVKVVFTGYSAVIELEGRKTRTRTASMAYLNPVYRRSFNLRHPVGDEHVQITWGSDCGLQGNSVAAPPMYAPMHRRQMANASVGI